MKLTVEDLSSLDRAMGEGEYSDYIYMYPPRQAYRKLEQDLPSLSSLAKDSFHANRDVNLYVHVPFCAQICRFCNLYTTAVHNKGIYARYVDRVVGEVITYLDAGIIPNEPCWRTLYLGGGTPSALPLDLLERLMSALRREFAIHQVEETAIEVSPETVSGTYLEGLRSLGFDRVSMGLQTTSPAEIRSIGRSYPIGKQAEVAAAAISLGFRNLCLDLIFGLPGQDERSWSQSLASVIGMRPHTICCYQWTSRPNTGFGRMGMQRISGPDMRRLYRTACNDLAAAGYVQETHVRWVLMVAATCRSNTIGDFKRFLGWGRELEAIYGVSIFGMDIL